MGWLEDAWESTTDWVEGAVDDAGEWVEGAVEDAGEWVEQAVEDAGEWTEQAVEDAGEWTEQAVEDAGEWTEQAVEDAGEWLEEAAVDVAEGAAEAADWFGNAADDYLFDPVDFLTGGLVDLDYDDGNFTASVGIEGVAGISASIGEDGFAVDVDAVAWNVEASYSDGDFAISGGVGIDWGPLPYVGGHLEISDEGDIAIGGKVQGVIIPTKAGVIIGGGEAEYYRNADGSWGVGAAADATLYMPSGTTVGIDGHVQYDEEADGDYTFNAGGGVSVGVVGGPEVRVGADYTESDIDGVKSTTVEGEVGVGVEDVMVTVEGGATFAEDAAGNTYQEFHGGVNVGQDDIGEVGVDGSYSRIDRVDGSYEESTGLGISGEGFGVEAEAKGTYNRAVDAAGNVIEDFDGDLAAAGYGLAGEVGGSVSNAYDSAGNLLGTTTSSDSSFDIDAEQVVSFAAEQLGADSEAAAQYGQLAGQMQSGDMAGMAQSAAQMAGAGDLSDAIGAMADTSGSSVADVASAVLDNTELDDFARDVVTSEVTEAAAEDVWDDLTP